MIEAIYISDHDDFYTDVNFSDGTSMSFTGELYELVGRLAHVKDTHGLGVDVRQVQAIYPVDDLTSFIGLSDGSGITVECDVPTAWNRIATEVMGNPS